MIRHALIASASLVLAAQLLAGESKELQAAKTQFAQSPKPTEADREHYILRLAALRDQFAKKRATADWQAVDAEIRRHPAPKDADAQALSKLRAGKWTSPRHDYLFRKDGTWTMLPAEPDATRGKWHIEGNRYFEDLIAATDRKPPYYTILLLTADNFIFTDGEVVFYETRSASR